MSAGFTLLLLSYPVGVEPLVGFLVAGDQADAAVCLRGTLVDVPVVLDELGGDGQCSGRPGTVFPADAADLAASGASKSDDLPEHVQPVLLDVVEKTTRLLRGPDTVGAGRCDGGDEELPGVRRAGEGDQEFIDGADQQGGLAVDVVQQGPFDVAVVPQLVEHLGTGRARNARVHGFPMPGMP
ncbi:hypothetical protein [Actinacidiphila oryziradicis]|uniref:hypothetical protein n=1 Tax=Actinacidiphila oryziradicis TaxID=2571141 RepID=UPI003899180D